jgi:hypothetical protein
MQGSKRSDALALFVIIALQLSVVLFYSVRKQGLHIDEILSYNLANAYFKNQYSPVPGFDTWIQPTFFHDLLVVSRDHRFAYDSVFFNQSQDVHPPFYYVLLHTISSFFPAAYSKWYGLSLNAALFVVCDVFLFLLSRRLLRDRLLSFVPVILWGFSAGAVSTAIFIRMYMLLTALTVIFVYCHAPWLERETPPKPSIAVSGAALLGVLTQYYFLIFAFFWASLCFLVLLLRRQWRQSVVYVASLLGAFFAAYFIFPQSIQHLFSSYRGATAAANLAAVSDMPSRLRTMLAILSGQQFGGLLPELAAILACLLVWALICGRRASPTTPGRRGVGPSIAPSVAWTLRSARNAAVEDVLLVSLTVSTIGTLIVVAKISPLLTSRYLFFIYPVVTLTAVGWILRLCSALVPNRQVLGAGVLCVFLVATGLSYKRGWVHYARADYATVLATARAYANYDCVYVTERTWVVVSSTLELANFRRTYVVRSAGVTGLPAILGDPADEKGIVMYIDAEANGQDILASVLASTRYDSSTLLYSTDFSKAYLVR